MMYKVHQNAKVVFILSKLILCHLKKLHKKILCNNRGMSYIL